MKFKKTITQTQIADINGDAFVSEVTLVEARNLAEAIQEAIKPYGGDTFVGKIWPHYAEYESNSKGIHIQITDRDLVPCKGLCSKSAVFGRLLKQLAFLFQKSFASLLFGTKPRQREIIRRL